MQDVKFQLLSLSYLEIGGESSKIQIAAESPSDMKK